MPSLRTKGELNATLLLTVPGCGAGRWERWRVSQCRSMRPNIFMSSLNRFLICRVTYPWFGSPLRAITIKKKPANSWLECLNRLQNPGEWRGFRKILSSERCLRTSIILRPNWDMQLIEFQCLAKPELRFSLTAPRASRLTIVIFWVHHPKCPISLSQRALTQLESNLPVVRARSWQNGLLMGRRRWIYGMLIFGG